LAAASAGTMFLSLVTPALAETTIEITGNGYNSTNDATVKFTGDTTVYQENTAIVINKVESDADTGNNDANQNTGGSVGVLTGDASTKVAVSNLLNSNIASVDCCDLGDTHILISENGAETDNDATIKDYGDIYVDQYNKAFVKNDVDADADTGDNDANQNTGGEVLVATGNAKAKVEISTIANANEVQVGSGGQSGSELSAEIVGNGYKSINDIYLKLDQDITLNQENSAKVFNEVDADADTGDNDANQNTGGDVLLHTGNAKTWIEVDNMVNFNSADVDCGCVVDLLAKIGVNGAETDNDIYAKLGNDLWVNQGYDGAGNFALLKNYLDGDSDTGKNDVDQNTGDPEGDPAILTGDAWDHVAVENSGNVNVYGEGAGIDWPELPNWSDFDFDFNITLNLGQLMGWLGLV